ncbi:hypothetical protein EV360DRAFT_82968 [Lentinula raphanica]|nr:hypothetical protein EV360DRAFT_82968 [Lentinula raphanica]
MRLVAINILLGLCLLVRSVPMPPGRARTFDVSTLSYKPLPPLPPGAQNRDRQRGGYLYANPGLAPPPPPKKSPSPLPSKSDNLAYNVVDPATDKAERRTANTLDLGRPSKTTLFTRYDWGLQIGSSHDLQGEEEAESVLIGYLTHSPEVAKCAGVDVVNAKDIRFKLSYPYSQADAKHCVRATVQISPKSKECACDPFCFVTAAKKEKNGEVVFKGKINSYKDGWPLDVTASQPRESFNRIPTNIEQKKAVA